LAALFAVAVLAGGDWPERARWAALALHEGTEDADLTVQLLGHMRDAFDELGERLSTVQLLTHLVNRGDASPWVRCGVKTWTRATLGSRRRREDSPATSNHSGSSQSRSALPTRI